MTWRTALLGDLVDVLDSQRKPITKSERHAGPFPYYGATGIVDWVDGYLFDEPLVLIGEDGAKWGAGDQSAFRIEGKTWVNNHAHVLRPHRETILDDWLVYFLNWADLSGYVSGMTVPKLNQGSLRQIEIPLPPLDEQKRIVAALDQAFAALDRARANTKKNLVDRDLLWENALASTFNLEAKPTSEKAQICDFFRTMTGSTPPKSSAHLYGGTVPFVKPPQLQGEVVTRTEDSLTEEGASLARVAPVGTVLVSCIGNLGKVGQLAVPSAFNQQINAILPGDFALPEFVAFQCRSPGFQRQLSDQASGTTISIVNKSQFNRLNFWLPSKQVQAALIVRVQELEDHVSRLEAMCRRKLGDIAQLEQSLLQAAFSGQLS